LRNITKCFSVPSGEGLPRTAGLALLAGNCTVLFGPLRPQPGHVFALLGLLLLSWLARRKALGRSLLLAMLAMLVTLASAADELARRWPASLAGERVVALVRIDSLIAQQSGALQFDAEVHIEAPVSTARHLRARVVWRDPPRPLPEVGEQWRVILQLSPPQRPLNPGAFDMTRQWFGERLHAQAQVVPAALTQQVARAAPSVLALRAAIAARIRDSIADRDAAALCAGLAVGATGEISREQWRIFSATGTTHLVAISGMHVTLFAWLMAAVARRAWPVLQRSGVRIEREPFAAALGVSAALLYAVLAGFGVPTQRTVVMLAAYWWLKLSGREQDGFGVLNIALIVVLCLDPFAPLAAGFWLSFSAMAALLLGDVLWQRGAREWSAWRMTLLAEWRVALVLVPVTLAWFGTLSFAGLAVNIVAIPVFSFVLVPLVLAGTALCGSLETLAGLLWRAAEQVYLWLWPPLSAAGEWPWALLSWQAPAWLLIVMVLMLPVWLVPVPRLWRGVASLLLAAAVTLALFTGAERGAALETGEVAITLFDVGDGTAVLVRTARHTLVYDTGESFGTAGQRVESVITPALGAYGRRLVDVLILSRAHGSRATGAARLGLQSPEQKVLFGGAWAGSPRGAEPCATPRRWVWDGVRFSVFTAPLPDASCVLYVDAGASARVLLAERLDATEATALLQREPASARERPIRADIALAPRRGSSAALVPGFAAAVAARDVLVSSRSLEPAKRQRIAALWGVSPERVRGTAAEGALVVRLRGGVPALIEPHATSVPDRLWRWSPY
jgi:competence protein ComEC